MEGYIHYGDGYLVTTSDNSKTRRSYKSGIAGNRSRDVGIFQLIIGFLDQISRDL